MKAKGKLLLGSKYQQVIVGSVILSKKKPQTEV